MAVISVVSTLLLVGVSVFLLATLPPNLQSIRFAVAVLPLVLVVGCLPFMVRGYVLTETELVIERLGWTTRWLLANLNSAEVDPDALKRSIRLCGNGGLLSFTGWFRNKKLGVYRLFATDPKRSVVLKFRSRTLVITPDQPAEFVAEALRRKPGGEPPRIPDSGG